MSLLPSSSMHQPSSLATPDEMKHQELQQQAWRYEAWLHTWTLNRSTVLDYFKFSSFYDRTCNNEIALMQSMSFDSLKQMEGLEYSVDEDIPTEDFFVIKKYWRVDANTVNLLGLYYVIGVENMTNDPLMPPRGTVLPMPDFHSVLKTNLSTSFLFLKSAFDELNSHVKFHPAVHGYQWEFGGSGSSTDEKTRDEDSTNPSSTSSITVASTTQTQRHQFSSLIDSAILSISQPILPTTQQQTGQR